MVAGSFSKAARYLRKNGISAFLSRARDKLVDPFVQYWYTDHLWEGKIFERMGNKSKIDGVMISLDNPYIATKNKGALWKGIYEAPERRLFYRYFPLDLPVIELGASVGVLACVTNSKLLNPKQHVVVEANPQLIPTLKQNRDLNGCQFKIVAGAVAYGTQQVTFYVDEKFTDGSLEHKTGVPITVSAYNVQFLAQSEGFDRFNLICDIEGAEIHLVQHEIDYLQAHTCWLLVEKHPKIVGAKPIEEMDARLRDGGFELVDTFHRVACYRNTQLDCGEAELLKGTK
jgi:FkbM family methyltransferase